MDDHAGRSEWWRGTLCNWHASGHGIFCVFIVYKSQSIILKVQNRIRSNRTGCHKYEGVLQISKYKRDNWSYEYINVKRGYGPQGTINVKPIQAWCSRRYRHCPKRTTNDKSKYLQIAMVSRICRTRNHALKEPVHECSRTQHQFSKGSNHKPHYHDIKWETRINCMWVWHWMWPR